jgi:hypothetical protein
MFTTTTTGRASSKTLVGEEAGTFFYASSRGTEGIRSVTVLLSAGGA